MKTKHVRPVLVEYKGDIRSNLILKKNDNTLILFDDKFYQIYLAHQEFGNFNPQNATYQELILISLEDEKIEVGDTIYDTYCNINLLQEVRKCDLDSSHNKYNYWKKVIARQSQISPEYISKFIEQYNNGCVEDIEIEMEHYWINSDNVKGNSFTEVAKFEPPINGFDAVLIIQPKLTNGFITIVERKLIYFPIEVKKDSIVLYGAGKFHEERLVLNRDQAALLFVELYKFLEFHKEITYTEKEVKLLCNYAMEFAQDRREYAYELIDDWFENNKKK